MADIAETRQVDAAVVTQEMAYRDMPPALDDPTIQGLLRIPNRQRLRTIEQRDDCEYDYRWYRYASHSFGLLAFIAILAVASLGLSLWQNNGNLGHQLDGTPRTLISQSVWESDDEAGITDHLWQVRSLGAVTAGLAALIGIKLYFGSSSVGYGSLGQLRLVKFWYIFAAFLAFVGLVSYVVAFSMAIGNVKDVYNLEYNARFTFEAPDNKEEIHTWVTVFDMITFGLAAAAIYVLVKHGLLQGDLSQEAKSWKQAGRIRDMDAKGPTSWYAPRRAAKAAPAEAVEEEIADGVPTAAKKTKKAKKPATILRDHFHNVRFVKSTFGLIVLFALLSSVIINITGTILMHRYMKAGDRLMGSRGRTAPDIDWHEQDDDDAAVFNGPTADFERAGWPVKNQRFRIGLASALIAIFLFLLVPWRHRLIHWVATLLILVISIGFWGSFIMDVNTIEEVKDEPCPLDWGSQFDFRPVGWRTDALACQGALPSASCFSQPGEVTRFHCDHDMSRPPASCPSSWPSPPWCTSSWSSSSASATRARRRTPTLARLSPCPSPAASSASSRPPPSSTTCPPCAASSARSAASSLWPSTLCTATCSTAATRVDCDAVSVFFLFWGISG